MQPNPRGFLTSGFAFCEWILGLFCQYNGRVIFAISCPHIQDNIIRETANDPSTLGRAYSVTVLLFWIGLEGFIWQSLCGNSHSRKSCSLVRKGPTPGYIARGLTMAATVA